MPLTVNQQNIKFPVLDVNSLQYSDKYFDEKFEYRHIILPKEFSKLVPRTHLMTETEWRNLGIQQSPGWVHYLLHAPEPHVLMFRRVITNNTEAALELEHDDEEEGDKDDGMIDYEMHDKEEASDTSNDSNIVEMSH